MQLHSELDCRTGLGKNNLGKKKKKDCLYLESGNAMGITYLYRSTAQMEAETQSEAGRRQGLLQKEMDVNLPPEIPSQVKYQL